MSKTPHRSQSRGLPRGLSRGASAGVLAVLVAVSVSGCGASGLHAGVAAEVGADTVSAATVDRLTTDYCDAVREQLAGQSVPLSYLRGGIAGQLAREVAARQLAAEYGVEAGKDYDDEMASLTQAVAALPEAQQQAVLEVEGASAYIRSVTAQVGRKVLASQGKAGASDEEAASAGQQALADWLDAQDVAFDPRYSITIKDGQTAGQDTSLSFPLGDAAVRGSAEAPDQAYASSLPAAQRCG